MSMQDIQPKTHEKPVVAFEDVGFSYEPHEPEALTDISFTLAPHSLTAIVGPSGCGKSTLLKLVAGIEKPTRGVCTIAQNPNMVFQNAALLPWLSARDNVIVGLYETNHSEAEKEKRADKELKELGIGDFMNTYPRDLSGGQRQRVGIARALAADPDLLLLDEPFSALDAETTERLRKEVEAIAMRRGVTMLMVSHNIEDAVLLADEVFVMDKGKITHRVKISLPRPRKRDDIHVHADATRIRSLLSAL